MALIVLTNDDGYDAAGFQALYNTLKQEEGFEVFVSAPRYQQSGASHSLTLRRPIRVERLRDKFFVVDGTPTDCVLLAFHDLLGPGKIDLVISGINHGPNMGSDVFYSGTVAAALQAATLGIRSMAVSVDDMEFSDFNAAARYTKGLTERVLKATLPKLILNVNIPRGRVKGEKITKMGKRVYQDKVISDGDKNGVKYSVIDGVLSYKIADDTDFKATSEGYISITPLMLDLTDYDSMGKIGETLGIEAVKQG
jgi:5'-nucleotidase